MNKFILYVGLALSIILTCQKAGFSQISDNSLLDKRVPVLKIEANSINNALSTIAIIYKAPLGLELAIVDDEENEKIRLTLMDVSLREALDETIKIAVNYTWDEKDGVINVFPHTNRDLILKELFETRINSLSLQKDQYKLDVRDEITNVPEIRAKLSQLELTVVNIASRSGDFREIGLESELTFSNVSLREILNRIIKQSGSHYWVVGRFGEENKLLTIRIQ